MATRNRKKKPEGTRPQSITFADAFAGIHRALALAGATLAWACEFDVDAADTYRRNFGYDPTGDMTAVRAETVPHHDILCAGFPCQSFSVEGKRLGMNDPRGRLFWHIVRILTAKRPRGFILENVPHLLRIDGGKTFDMMCSPRSGFEATTSHLTALGYTLRYTLLDARRFGLPQRRERLFVVGTLGSVPFAFPKQGKPATHLRRLLQCDIPERYYFTDEERSRMAGRRDLARVTRSNRCCNFVKATHANTLLSDPKGVEKNVVVEPDDGRAALRTVATTDAARIRPPSGVGYVQAATDGQKGVPATRQQCRGARRAGGGQEPDRSVAG